MIAVLALACAVPERIPVEEFPRWTADVLCRRTRECLRGDFEASFYGLGDCRATLERQYDALAGLLDDQACAYDAARAGRALAEIEEMTCEQVYEGDVNEALADVWEGCVGFTTDTTRYGYGYYYQY